MRHVDSSERNQVRVVGQNIRPSNRHHCVRGTVWNVRPDHYHPGVASYNGGFLVTVGDAADKQILVQRYRFNTADWVPQTFPTLHYAAKLCMRSFYDVCGTNSNVCCFAIICPQIAHGYPDVSYWYNALIAFTIDAETLQVTHARSIWENEQERQLAAPVSWHQRLPSQVRKPETAQSFGSRTPKVNSTSALS